MYRLKLLVAVLFCAIKVSPAQEVETVPVTARHVVTKRAGLHAYRLQANLTNDVLRLEGFGFNKLPKSLKFIRIDELHNRINRRAIETNTLRSLDSTYTILRDPALTISYKIPDAGSFEREKENFTRGHRVSGYFANQWVNLAALSVEDAAITTFRTKGLFRTYHSYLIDFLPAAVAWEFPSVDPWNCEPVEVKFFKLRKMQGYGTGKIKYTPYETTTRKYLRKAFDVYFKHNETIPDPSGLAQVTDYLDQNNYTIMNAELEGGSSIEGTAERNRYLQTERARVLQRALHRYSEGLLRKDTVKLVDAMKQFRVLVSYTPHKWLTELTSDSIQTLVNVNDSIRALLEPTLEIQRKASLKLVVRKKLTHDELFVKLVNRLNATVSMGNATLHPEVISALMGMIDHLFTFYEEGGISSEELSNVYDQTSNPDWLKILTGLHILKKYEDKTWPKDKVASWADYWKAYDIEAWLDDAEHATVNRLNYLITLPKIQAKDERVDALRMLTDFQAYKYEFIELGLVDINSLCTLSYPKTPTYTAFILNQYAFLYEMAAQKGITISCMPGVLPRSREARSDSTLNTDRYLKNLEAQYETKKYMLMGNRLVREKTFNTNQKGPYYYLLKEHFLKNNAAALSAVENSDGSNVLFDVFNLWHLLAVNVKEWDPFENYFHDQEVQVEEMSKLIGMMKKYDRILCKTQVNALYLSFHLKVLYYIQRYQEAGNAAHTKSADASLKYITNYYKARARNIDPKLSMHIIKQLNHFNWLPGKDPGAWYGYDLLNMIAHNRLLSDEELKMYVHYLKLFNPQLKRLPRLGFDKAMITELWEESF